MPDLFTHVDPPVRHGATPYVPARPKSDGITLRPYQEDVTDRARRRAAAGGRRGIIQGETGSGKTVVGARFCQLTWEKGRRALVIADRRRLVNQFGGTLDRMKVPYGVVMAGATRRPNAPVVLASRDTLAAWASLGRDAGEFDMVIVDECHKAVGATYQRLLATFPKAFHLGLTATPVRGDGKPLASFYQWIECTVPASQLIAEGYLVKPELFQPKQLAARRRAGAKVKGLAGDPVSHWRRHADGLPTIAFAQNVSESLALRDRFVAGGVAAEHIDGTAGDDEREAAFGRLVRGETMVLCSVRLLIEGVDIPDVACAILWAKFSSLVDYRQAPGRIMRPAPGKTRAVVLDHSGAAGYHESLPGDDIEWSLGHAARVKPPGDPKDAKPVTCRECGLGFRGVVCPGCGWQPKERRRPSAGEPAERAADELLTRYETAGQAARTDMARQRQWTSILYAVVNQSRRSRDMGGAGVKAAAAAVRFHRHFGVWPEQAGVSPAPAGRFDRHVPADEFYGDRLHARATA